MKQTFSKPTRIRDAIAKIACARNLLSFFADYYLPLENLLFSDEQTVDAKNFPGYCDCQLYLNHKEDIEVPEEPFLIMTNKFSENFSEVWTNWLKFTLIAYIFQRSFTRSSVTALLVLTVF